jgi:anti-anti-sigma regulatory factor
VIPREQVVQISARATSFTAVCVECADLETSDGYLGATFAGRLELDLQHGAFLCRRGHSVRVERAAAETGAAAA